MPKPKEEYLTVMECPICHKEEYYGMMYWLNCKMLCRRCFKKISKNGADIEHFFPYFEDGIDYTQEQEQDNGKNIYSQN
jgi:hypothetical protein